jgi:hypothetical protein
MDKLFTCNFCNKNFSCQFTLKRHQKSKICTTEKEKVIFKCKVCLKILSTKQYLQQHLLQCETKAKKLVELEIEKNKEANEKQHYKKLEEKLDDMSRQIETLKTNPPTTITINSSNVNDHSTKIQANNNTSTHNYGSILSITKDMIKDVFKKNYTLKDLAGSQKALANFTTRNIINNSDMNNPVYLCKDKTRQKFVFTDEEQNEVEDIGASMLIKLVSKGLDHTNDIYKKEAEKLTKKIERLEQTDTDNDNYSVIVEIRDQLNLLRDNYEETINIMKDGDRYRAQLAKMLPTSLTDRMIVDKKLKELSSETESDDDEEVILKKVVIDKVMIDKEMPYELHDKTALHIGGMTYGKLILYKKHYQKTGEVKIPERFIQNKKLVDKFYEYIESDD